jgi:NitT/TauT family transport system substrate-binding protein
MLARLIVCALALCCLALGAVSPARADDTLTLVAGSAPGIYDALELVAEGAGFYKDEHLTVVEQYATGPGTAAQLVASGKGDIVSLTNEPILLGYDKGLHLQIFMARESSFPYELAVLADSPIRTLADFKGAVLGEIVVGSAGEPSSKSMLAGAGLQPGDYTFVPIGAGAQGLEALTSKRVAGAAFPNQEIYTYEVVGHAKFRTFRNPLLSDFVDAGFASAPATIQAKGEALKHFCRAIAKAAVFIRENPIAAAKIFIQQSKQKMTDEAVNNIAQELLLSQNQLPAADPNNKHIGLTPPRDIAVYTKFLSDYGVLKAPIPPAAVSTNAFIPFANDFDHQAVIALAKNWK